MQGIAIKHTIYDTQKQTFTQHVNQVLKRDADIKDKIPISSDRIFQEIQDGIILCKLINAAASGKVPVISPEAINLNPNTTYHKIQNLNLAISSAKSIGCTVINVRPQFIQQKRQHIVLGLIWQIIKIHFSNQITLKKHPQIIALKKPQEDQQDLKKLGYEQILIRWLNYHIKKNGGARVIKNLGADLADCQAYGHVLTNIGNLHQKFWGKDQNEKAVDVISTCHKLKIMTKIKPQDIVTGNTQVNTMLCVQIFNQKHGIELKELKVVDLPPEQQTDQTREMRIFKNWINSQGIEDVYVSYLMTDLRDGRILLKVLDNFKKNIVDWEKKYSNKLNSRIHIIQNCNYVLQLCKQLGVKLIGIDGVDIADGKAKLTLGLVWQICSIYWEKRVGKINQDDLLKWGNDKVEKSAQIKSLKDPSISNCKFILQIIDSIKPKVVNFDKLKEGTSQQDQISNINYTISSARKLGAEVITLWQHIKQANPRYVGVLLAQLQQIQKFLASK